ncbi:MAG TPA: long-chain fatty acid--CoA ligase [Polyangiales bacterium]|nr:long-chain fatty acid--CoA ligase [Polyangiales bacterium]
MSERHFAFWPPKVPRAITLPATSLWYNLEVAATRYPQKACTVFYDSVITYADFRQQAERLAGYLQRECGVQRGDRVALYMHNSPQFMLAYYAVLRADAMVVPVNPMCVSAELAYVLEDSGARVLIGAQTLFAHVEPLLDRVEAVVATYSDALTTPSELAIPDFVREPRRSFASAVGMSDAIARGIEPGPHLAGPEDRCVMPYTSGTTGQPKGCVHTHRSVMHTAISSSQWHRSYADETILTVLPLFHVTGMQNGMNGPIYAGATMVVLPRWDRDVAAALIQRFRVTGWTSVPTMVVDLLSSPKLEQYDLSSLRSMGGGGAAMPEAIAKKLEQLCNLTYVEGYGLSETAAATHINPQQNPKKQCLGIPIFGVDSRVVDPETLQELPPGEVGEIISHGPQVFEGYWNRPDANAASFVQLDGKRFFRTGDLGRTDEDGYFFLVDRIKRMINAAGFKVWPAEVEAQLYAHPGIKEAAVIAQRDARRGETVKAIVVREPSSSLGEAELIDWARGQMAAYKVPRSIEFVDELPKTASGKILWRALQEREDARSR